MLFYFSPQAMWIFDVKTLCILEVNNAAIKYYGFTRDEFLQKTIIDLRPPEDIPELIKVLPGIQSPTTNYREFKHVDKNGRIFPVEIMSHLIVFNGVSARLVTAQNIEEKKAIIGKLEFTQSKLNKILESTSIGFFQIDLNATITYWNNAAEKIIGYNREYLLGKNLREVFSEALDSDFYIYFQKAIKKHVNVEFVSYFWPVQKWLSVNIYPVTDGLFAHFRDITERKLYEEKLLEKIDQLKEVSYVNSHYMRKPVASLLGLTSLIAKSAVNDSDFKDIIAHIQACTEELDIITREVNVMVNNDISVGHIQEKAAHFSLTALVDDLIKAIHKTEHTHKIILISENDISIYGNKHSIAIAVKCLISNAIKFSPKAGKVTIIIETIDSNIVLSVKDSGIGINRQLVNRIFLGFNKKRAAKQLGTGLAKVSQVAKRHNGSVWVESKPGKGSVFSIRFPISNISRFIESGATDTYKSTGIRLEYNSALKCVVADWCGFHSFHTVKTGCLKVLGAVVENKCSLILNDNTNLMGTWDDAAEWVAKDFFPMLQQANVTHIAWVYSSSTFGRFSADLTIDSMSNDIIVKTFNDKSKAEEWLLQMQPAKV